MVDSGVASSLLLVLELQREVGCAWACLSTPGLVLAGVRSRGLGGAHHQGGAAVYVDLKGRVTWLLVLGRPEVAVIDVELCCAVGLVVPLVVVNSQLLVRLQLWVP